MFEPREENEERGEESRDDSDETDEYYDIPEEDFGYEAAVDDNIDHTYNRGEYQETRDIVETRLATVQRLRHEARKEKSLRGEPEEKDDNKFLRRHWLEYHEENPSPYAPTLGIEIEIREQSVRPKDAETWTDTQHSRWRSSTREKYSKTAKLGVPAGNDKLWEFAHKPVHYYHTLSREVQALIEMGLIPMDKENAEDDTISSSKKEWWPKHPLHLTIGGITTLPESVSESVSTQAYILSRALEATGWSTTGWRLLRPYKRRSWNIKGAAGIYDRYEDELELGQTKGIELRTLQLQSLTGLDRTLRSAFLLGAALKAYQEEEIAKETNNVVSHQTPERIELSQAWNQFAERCCDIFGQYGIEAPQNWDAWDYGHFDPVTEPTAFQPFAALLNDARENKTGRGAEFVRDMRKLVISTRAKIARILYPKPE
ncbi:MAG: hypothetical protein AAB539_04180 [Patescibacteria group bacterium]